MSYVIVTDSACNLPRRLVEQYAIRVIPLTLNVDNCELTVKSYRMDELDQLRQLYTKMRRGVRFNTHPLNKERCETVFREVLAHGDDLLYIGFSSTLSDTFATAKFVFRALAAAYPARTIRMVDSLAASLGEGLLVYHAGILQEQGEDLETVYRWLLANRSLVRQWFTVGNLQFLQKSGRDNGRLFWAKLLGQKPILRINERGALVPAKRVRSRKRALDVLVREMGNSIVEPDRQTVFIAHGDCIEDAQYLSRRIRERVHPDECLIHFIDPVVGAHCGPDTIGVFFLGKDIHR